MPTSFTIDNLEDDIIAHLQIEAARRGLDINSLARDLLRNSLGLSGNTSLPRRQRGLEQLAGTWSAHEAGEFLAAVSDFDHIDEGLWR